MISASAKARPATALLRQSEARSVERQPAMGHAASSHAERTGGQWDAKPVEAINDATDAVPRDELAAARERYDALKREHQGEALVAAGDALLRELGLAVAFHDAGSWTRVVARKTDSATIATHEPHEHMHEPQSPGAYLLRERLRARHPEGEVGLVQDLVRAKNRNHDARAPQIIVAFCDGTEKAHTAYLCAKNLVRPHSRDCLTVAAIESDCHGHDAKHQPAAIRHRYETDLTTFLPPKRWQFMHVPRSSVSPARVVAAFANDRAKLHAAARAHPDPSALCIGFSGRSSKRSDPTVVGQVADLAMRNCCCPTVICKHPPLNDKKRHFVYLADATERCIDGMKLLDGFLRKDDRLTYLHVRTSGTEEGLIRCFREYEKRATFEFVADGTSTLDVLQTRPCFADVDYVCVATRPKAVPGSFADTLVRHHAGNIIIIKSVV